MATNEVVDDQLAVEFEEHRRYLRAVAYRLLGSAADAEDAVQETWLRWARQATDRQAKPIDEPRSWLTTVISRVCLDELRSAHTRRQRYVGPWLPEPLVTNAPNDLWNTEGGPRSAGMRPAGLRSAGWGSAGVEPADWIEFDESVRLAFLVVLEQLTPPQRVAFVLHELFAVPFDQIAVALGATDAAARKLASRARKIVADADPPPRRPSADQLAAIEAFLTACENGDLDALARQLDPDVVAIGDGGGRATAGRHPVSGRDKVARLMLGLFSRFGPDVRVVHRVMLNGEPGLVFVADTATYLIGFGFGRDGLMTNFYGLVNPAKLRRIGLTAPDWPGYPTDLPIR